MAVRLIEGHEPIKVSRICCLVYGTPGSKKTSLAQTSHEPITLAFDEGIYRAFGRKRAAVFDTWADVLGFDLSGYKTIVIDTVGQCLVKLSEAIVGENPKNGTRLGGLSISGYGVLKSRFRAWIQSVKERGQNVVFIAHEDEEKVGDDTYHLPAITGKSYDTVMELCDMVGYTHWDNGKQVIEFTPSDRWMAKRLPDMGDFIGRFRGTNDGQLVMPDFSREPNFLGDLLDAAMANLGKVSAQAAEVAKQVMEWTTWLSKEPALDDINGVLLPAMEKLPAAVKNQVRHVFRTYINTHGLELDRATGKFRVKGTNGQTAHAPVTTEPAGEEGYSGE